MAKDGNDNRNGYEREEAAQDEWCGELHDFGFLTRFGCRNSLGD